ncbi:MAG: hypothetical protein ACC742_15125 [Thermoanaerobaculales bacterium]
MAESLDIKGGADEFEAAVVAVVVDQIIRDEKAAREGSPDRLPGLPAWMRALSPEEPNMPREVVAPDGQ